MVDYSCLGVVVCFRKKLFKKKVCFVLSVCQELAASHATKGL